METEELKNVLAPSSLEINQVYLRISETYSKTLFLLNYPRYLSTGWFSPIINLPEIMDISIHIEPVSSAKTLKSLERKVTEVEVQISDREEKGYIRDPLIETAERDMEALRDNLQQGIENIFRMSVYITIYADTLDHLKKLETKVISILEGRLVYMKPALFQQPEAFASVLPIGDNIIDVSTPFNTGPASSLFPFISANLTSDSGVFYGVNRQNNTLIIFDRFSLENANMVIFAKSGSGKSYAAKLEALRLLMLGVDVLIIDPEAEYKPLADAVGGSFFKISLSSEHTINPFEIPKIPDDEDPGDALKSHIVNLVGLIKIMIGAIAPEEDAVLDRAITETYASHDITPGKDFSQVEAPLLGDLERILQNMEGGRDLAKKIHRFTQGTFAGFTNRQTNIDLENRCTVFSLRDLEEGLRPIAMYLILHFVWNLVKVDRKKRTMIIDDAWWLMKYPEGALFLFSMAKRCRKYYLGLTTITQDIEDFLGSEYGRPIVTNSSLQLLLKQSSATIESVQKAFGLTDQEKNLLLEAPVGNGIFFAGPNHVMIQIVASYSEDEIITTNPEQLLHLETDQV